MAMGLCKSKLLLSLSWKALENGLRNLIWLIAITTLAGSGTAGASPEQPNFTFAIVGDRTGGANDEIFNRVISDLDFMQPDIIFTIGDHVEGYTTNYENVSDEWDRVLARLESIGRPCFYTPGNHDIWDATSREIFEEKAGPTDTSFLYKGCLFVILDVSMDYVSDRIDKERLVWLEKRLSEAGDVPKFVFYHKPFWCEDFSANRKNTLHEIFRRYGVTAVFTGHYHMYFETEVDGINYYCVPSSGGSLPGWSLPQSSFYGYFLVRVKPDTVIAKPFEIGLREHETITFADMIEFNSLKKEMIEIDEIEPVTGEYVTEVPVEVTIENLTSTILEDTLRWNIPQTWKVEPPMDYIEVPSGEVATINAIVSCSGVLFPVPSLRLCFERQGSRVCLVKPLKVRRKAVAEKVAKHIEMDGMIEDGEWSGARVIRQLYASRGHWVGYDSTLVHILHDSSAIYFGFECFETNPENLKATQGERDALGVGDDRISLLLEPTKGKPIFYEISFNPSGSISDRMVEICPFGSYVIHPEWNASIEAKAEVTDFGYVVEFGIRFADLGVSSEEISELGFNLSRWHSKSQVFEAFEIPYRYDPDRLGVLFLE